MIRFLRGAVAAVGAAEAVLDVHGVGYAVAITPTQARTLRVGGEVTLHTSFVVREDGQSLYGFGNVDELEVFELLLGVSGVGPKSALGVLAELTPAQIAAAVGMEDDAAFRRVSGIGPKTAKLIVVTLAGKLTAYAGAAADAPALPARPASDARGEAMAALTALGFPERRVADALDELEADDVGVLVRQSLSLLGGAR